MQTFTFEQCCHLSIIFLFYVKNFYFYFYFTDNVSCIIYPEIKHLQHFWFWPDKMIDQEFLI